MRPLAASDGHDVPRLIDELVPRLAAMIDDVVVGREDAVGEPVFAHELPDVLDRVEFRAFGRQRDDADVVGHDELVGHVPASLIHQHDRVGTRRDGERYLREMKRHGFGIAEWQDQTSTLAKLGADRAKDIGRFRPLVLRRRWPCSAPCPAARDLVFLADARFVLEPYLYGCCARESCFDLCQRGGKAPFLKASIANSFWA